MRVTILVPIYNVSSYIRECAESLLGQTYEDINYVFVDDCSPDNSIDILKEVIEKYPLRKDNVTILRHTVNKGLGGARRTGVEHFLNTSQSTDEGCMIVDSDDVLTPKAVQILVEKIQATDADTVDGAYAEYRSKAIGEPMLPYHGDDESHRCKILCQNILSNRVWGRLYTKEAIMKLSEPFFEGIDYSEDFCFIGRFCDIMHRAWVDDIVYLYRTDNMASYTKQMSKRNIRSFLRAYSVVYNYYADKYKEVPVACEIGMLNAYRVLRRNNYPLAEADELIDMKATHVCTRILQAMLRHKLPLADLAYRAYRSFVTR